MAVKVRQHWRASHCGGVVGRAGRPAGRSTLMAAGTGRLEGRVALITGGASGIGKATERLFLAEGAKVVIADIDPDALDEATKDLRATGNDITGVQGDVRSMQDAAAMVRTAVDSFGRLDILFCNAGITSVMPISELTEEEWDAVIDTNLKGMFTLIKQSVPQMRAQGGGTIITMGYELRIVAVPESP